MKYGHLIAAIGVLGFVGTTDVSALSSTGKSKTAPTVTPTSTTANVSETSGTVSVPGAVTFSPSVSSGVRTFSEGGINSGGNGSTVGAFVTPALKLSYSDKNVKVGLGYELEITGGKGLGSKSDEEISDSAYYLHNPTFTISGGVAPNWKLNGFVDAKFYLYNKSQNENISDIVLSPELEYTITPSVSVAVGYLLQRQTNFDSTVGPSKEAGNNVGLSSTDAIAAVVAASAEPVTNLHAAIVTTKVGISEGTKLTTYVRAGKKVGNGATSNAYAYRFQTHLDFATPVADLTGVARYRLNVEDVKNAAVNYYNLGRVELAYAITKNWTAYLANEFTAKQSTAKAKKATYENENYVGATFSF